MAGRFGGWWVLWVIGVTLVLTPLLSSSQHTLGPGTVEVSVRPATSGSMVLSFPPLGSVSAPTHKGPAPVTGERREIDVQPLIAGGGRLDIETLTSSVREDLGPALRSIVLRVVLVGAAVGAASVLVLPRRRPTRVVAGVLIGAVTSTSVVAVTLWGFDPGRFEEPTYEGPLAAGGSVLAAITSGDRSGLDARLDVLAARVADLYSASVTSDIEGSSGDVAILHVSDLHLNPVGVGLARQLAESFEVDAIVDTGDTTSFGFPLEESFSDLFADFDVPYYFVAGNHASPTNRTAFASAEGITSIDRKVVDVNGIRVLGFDDPVVTSTRTVEREERARIMKSAEPELRRLVEDDSPDVVAIHNPVMASAVAGEVPVVIAGHLHRSVLSADDGTVVAVVGSAGATGLGSLTVEADLPYMAQILRFRSGELVAIDTIELTGTSGDFMVQRRLVTDEMRGGEPSDELESDPDEGTEGEPQPTPSSIGPSTTPGSNIPTSTTSPGGPPTGGPPGDDGPD